MKLLSKTALKGSFAGAVIGYVVLHPISMLIIVHAMPGGMPGMAMNQGFMAIFMVALMAHHLVMSLYFTILGASFGLLAGVLYAKIHRQNEELRQQKLAVEEVLHEKDTLLRILSHDLSNQICAASGFAELLVDHKCQNYDAKEMVGFIKVALDRATNLINFSKTLIAIESGKIAITLVNKDIRLATSEAIVAFKESLEKKELSLVTDFGASPISVPLEPNIYNLTVIGNLVSNAIKFSNQGQTVNLTIKQVGNRAVVTISNYGPGMTKEKMTTLFSMKTRTTTLGTSGEKGTGLGLPLVCKFVKMMSGEVCVDSKPTAGNPHILVTTFSLSFPLAS